MRFCRFPFREVSSAAILLLALTAAAHGQERATDVVRFSKSWRGKVDGLPVLVLKGSHAERGTAHGTLFAREIIANCDHLATFIDRGIPGGWKTAVAEVERFEWQPRFGDELKGMAAALERLLPANERKLAATGKPMSLADLKVLNTADVFELFRCTQFSGWGPATKDGKLIVGRNFDYPPILPRENVFLLAVDPSEPDLHATIDPLWPGLIGSGIAAIRDDGMYVAPNSGGSSGGRVTVPHPTSGGLVLRAFLESADPAKGPEQLVAALEGRVVLPLLFHLVPPAAELKSQPPVIVEYHPTADPKPTVRQPDPTQPNALFVANHYVDSTADLSRGRCGIVKDGVCRCISERRPIGFDEARQILDAARQDNTYISVVCWPHERTLKIAVATADKPATECRFATIRWEDLFGEAR